MICDFCSDRAPTWSFGCATFHIPEQNATSLNEWLACDACAELIHKKAWRALAIRSSEKTDNGRMLVHVVGKTTAVRTIEQFHKGFRRHATGASSRLAEAEKE